MGEDGENCSPRSFAEGGTAWPRERMERGSTIPAGSKHAPSQVVLFFQCPMRIVRVRARRGGACLGKRAAGGLAVDNRAAAGVHPVRNVCSLFLSFLFFPGTG